MEQFGKTFHFTLLNLPKVLDLSSQVQQSIEENLKGRLPAEAFAWTTVEFGDEGCYLALIKVLYINRLGRVFMDKAVCVLICSAFP